MRRLLFCVATAGLVLSACGDDDPASSTTTRPSITMEEWVAAVNEKCSTTEQFVAELATPTSPEEIAEYIDLAAQIQADQFYSIAEFDPPAGHEDEIAEVLETALGVETAFEAAQEAQAAGDDAAVAAEMATLADHTEALQAFFDEYGVTECWTGQESSLPADEPATDGTDSEYPDPES